MLPQQVSDILARKPVGTHIEISGWVRTRRDSGGVSFLEISDGSCLDSLQVVADSGLDNYDREIRKITTGTSIQVAGLLVDSPAKAGGRSSGGTDHGHRLEMPKPTPAEERHGLRVSALHFRTSDPGPTPWLRWRGSAPP